MSESAGHEEITTLLKSYDHFTVPELKGQLQNINDNISKKGFLNPKEFQFIELFSKALQLYPEIIKRQLDSSEINIAAQDELKRFVDTLTHQQMQQFYVLLQQVSVTPLIELTDSIILRKNIETNLSQAYELLNSAYIIN